MRVWLLSRRLTVESDAKSRDISRGCESRSARVMSAARSLTRACACVPPPSVCGAAAPTISVLPTVREGAQNQSHADIETLLADPTECQKVLQVTRPSCGTRRHVFA